MSWGDGRRDERDLAVAARWRIRLISDRAAPRIGGAPTSDFVAAIDRDTELWVRPFSDGGPLARCAGGLGMDLEIVGDITLGLPHRTSVRTRPGDDAIARWSCSCGAGSRGDLPPDLAGEAADLHAGSAPASGARRTDRAVTQGEDGAWSQREIPVSRRFRACARSDFSRVPIHRTGYGEEFELAVDGTLGLWVRRLGADAALRRDESARGISLLVLGLL